MSYEDDALIAAAVTGRRVGSNGWIRTNCPLCSMVDGKEDRKQSLGFNARTNGYNCFKCMSKGRLRQAPDEYDLPLEEEDDDEPQPIEPPEFFYPLEEDDSESLVPAWEYLLAPVSEGGRGLTEAQVVEAKIGACTEGKFGRRVIIPVMDARGVWWWYVGRAWTKKHPKPYLYPSGARHGIMYNQQALSVETDEPVLVMEGCFDALSYWPHAVAVLGKTTDDHIATLKRAKRPVVFCPDGDEWESGEAHMMSLRLDGRPAGALRLPPKVDPDEVPRAALRKAAIESLA